MIRILFICHGNICRSVMAEYILKDLARRRNCESELFIDSAATSMEEIGNPIYPPARAVLQVQGVPVGTHRARQLQRREYGSYDLIIGMDRENMRRMRDIFGGDPEGKLHMLSEYAGFEGEIADPWYTRNFELTYRQIEAGCRGLLDRLADGSPKGSRG